jgi:hypothetical protein
VLGLSNLLVDIVVPFVVAALVMGGITIWGRAEPARVVLGWTLAVGLGFFSYYLGREGFAGLSGTWVTLEWAIVVIVPAGMVATLLALRKGSARALGLVVSLVSGLGLAPLLMQNYLFGIVGDWSAAVRFGWFAALGLWVLCIWRTLVLLERRWGGRSLPLGLAGIAAGFAGVMMLSDSITTAESGLAVMALLLGGIVGGLGLPNSVAAQGVSGISWLLIATLVIQGHFYADTDPITLQYVLLGLSPLLLWASEDPLLRSCAPWVRGGLRLLVTALPVILALMVAAFQFLSQMDSASPYQ